MQPLPDSFLPVQVDLPGPGSQTEDAALAALFAEELGLVLEVSPQHKQAVLEAYQQAGVPVRAVGSVTADPQVAISVDGQQQITGQSISTCGLPAPRPHCRDAMWGHVKGSLQDSALLSRKFRHSKKTCKCAGVPPSHSKCQDALFPCCRPHHAAGGCVGSHCSFLLQPRLQRHWTSADVSALLQACAEQLRSVWPATRSQTHHSNACSGMHAGDIASLQDT